MKLQDILKIYREHPELKAFGAELKEAEKERFRIKGTVGSQFSMLLTAMFQNIQRNTLVVLNDKEDALYFLNDLQALMPKKEILFFPASYKRPYQIEEVDNANVLQRAEVLNQLNHTHSGRQLIITFAEALSEKVINKRSLVRNTLDVKKGDDCGMDFIVDVLDEYGFEPADYVWEPGTYSKRGGILDVFSFAHEYPYRIEFFGEDVESIRSFDPVDQMSREEHTKVALIPNIQKNLLHEEKTDFLGYMSEKMQVFVQSVDFVMADLNRQYDRALKYWETLQAESG
ncbi:MAG: transcription-repair coupling factor, partial [Bacteroidota bacterium]